MVKAVASLLSGLLLLLSAAFFFLPAEAQTHELRSLKIRETQVGSGCSYTVRIRTSCSSPRYTRDRISIAFGDAYRNEVYAPRLDDPSSGAFEQCSTDTFKLAGPCGYGVCYLYLRRDGWDGWTPEWVKVLDPYSGRTLTFYYGSPIPNAVWFGFDYCHYRHHRDRGAFSYPTAADHQRPTGGDPIAQV